MTVSSASWNSLCRIYHVADTLSQLKEMRHYSKNNVELLIAQWLMLDDELSALKQAAKIENLMRRAGLASPAA